MKGKNEAVQAVWTYVALLVLLVISVGLRVFHLGIVESILLLVIAGIEAVAVLLFFMRVKASSRLIWLFAGGGFLWLGILLVFVISDYVSRSWWR
ncbi:MAG: caa(3)-type oxidase subunit IV [Verrucomicrobia bacterium]|nr:caa(3)-type oxidase subunit IV [Verrucomicrobiota bacterium]MBV8485772.1 caa(3)-type oxidase subunit IV [Verrucomicrobiota bacterium]